MATELQKLKKKLDKELSKYVRSKKGVCYTCGKRKDTYDAGHWIPRHHYSTRYDPRNVKKQCLGCNRFRGGEPGHFAAELIKEYGEDGLISLAKRGKQLKQWSKQDLLTLLQALKDNNYEETYRRIY